MVGGMNTNSTEVTSPFGGDTGFRFNGWCSFVDLDSFNSDHLVGNLALKDPNGRPFVWKSDQFIAKCSDKELSIITSSALRQAESLFNLSQLMFALYHGSVQACTFMDLQKNRPPRDVRQRGFVKLDDRNTRSGTSFRQALHELCWNIVEAGGLPVIFSMIQNPILSVIRRVSNTEKTEPEQSWNLAESGGRPLLFSMMQNSVLPIIQQKCLDALTNILCVDQIEWLVLTRQPWFFNRLVQMIQKGNLQCDMVPAISVIDRLIVIILGDKMDVAYQQLLDSNFMTICIDELQDPRGKREPACQHFVKFQTIAMQALALLCQDERSARWEDKIRERVFTHAYQCAIVWNTEQPPSDPDWDRSESFYRNMSFSSSALLFSLIILIHAVLKWPGKKEHLEKKGLMFRYQLSKMMTLAMCESSVSKDSNAPIIKNAVEWLLKSLFPQSAEEIKSVQAHPLTCSGLFSSIVDPLSELCEKVYRKCSSRSCNRRESQVGQWSLCSDCNVVCYCSDVCRLADGNGEHTQATCIYLSMKDSQ